jgi:choline dehydrogenase-like flavoprotein
MLIDSRTLPANEVIEADICIVGAGAAGITLAHELSGSGQRVILVESGGVEADSRTQDLYRGDSIGLEYDLSETRCRYLGGTTNLWGGACRQLDELDFVARDWMPNSGWPFTLSTILPYYQRARAYLELPQEPDKLLPFPWSQPFEGALWEGSPTRFGKRYLSGLKQSPDVKLLLNANLLELSVSGSGIVESALFGIFGDRYFSVNAKRYVLACGGLENARLLLATNRANAGKTLNPFDLVGRFFMEHPGLRVGYLVHDHPATPEAIYFERGGHSFRLSDETQQSERVGSAGCYPHGYVRLAEVPGLSKLFGSRVRGPMTILMVAFEQTPEPDSRVTLSDERDEFGMPRLRLDWRLNDGDRRTFATIMRLISMKLAKSSDCHLWLRPELRSTNFDRPETISLAPFFSRDFKVMPYVADGEIVSYDHGIDTSQIHANANHHMGTTRMHDDPRQGVVDSRCLVHGSQNLYVTGSSCFPTGGISNPTYTIVAMAIRLADHLKDRAQA